MGKKELIKGGIYQSLSNYLITIGNFLFWIIVGKLLKIEDIGIITYVFSFSFTISSLSLLGLNYAILRELRNKKDALINSILIETLSIIIVSVLIYITINPEFFIYIFVLSLFFSILSLLNFSLLSLLKYKEIFYTNLLAISLKLILSIILVLFLKLKYIGIIISLIVPHLISLIIYTTLLREYFIRGKIKLCIIKELIKIGISNYPNLLSTFLITSIGTMILSFHDKRISSLFYFSMMTIIVLTIIPNSLNTLLIPINVKSNKDLTKEGFRVGMVVTIPISIVFLFFSKYLFKFINPELSDAYNFVKILIFLTISESFINNAISKFNSEKKLKELFILGFSRILTVLIIFKLFYEKIFLLLIVYVLSSITISLILSIYLSRIKILVKSYIALTLSYILYLINPILFVFSPVIILLLRLISFNEIMLILKWKKRPSF